MENVVNYIVAIEYLNIHSTYRRKYKFRKSNKRKKKSSIVSVNTFSKVIYFARVAFTCSKSRIETVDKGVKYV